MNYTRHPQTASATGQSANARQREGCASTAQPAWCGLLSTLRRALAMAARQVSSCRRATQAEYSTLRGRIRAFRRIECAYDRLSAASAQLQRAAASLRAILEAIAADPASAGRAPLEIPLAAGDILRMSARVAAMSLALDAASALVEANSKIGRPHPIPSWLYSRYPSNPIERIRLLLRRFRRRRTRCLATEDAPRRVSRGRAPPFLSACSL